MKFVMFEMEKAGWVGGDVVVAEVVDWKWGDEFLVGEEGVDEIPDMMKCWRVIIFFLKRKGERAVGVGVWEEEEAGGSREKN